MSRLSIVIHFPPEALGARKRLFERFREAAAERLRRLFPEAEADCRAGASGAIDVTFASQRERGESTEEPGEDEGRAEVIREEVAAVLEELLVEDDSWWDEEERRRAAAESDAAPEPPADSFAEARDWGDAEVDPAEDGVPEEEWSTRALSLLAPETAASSFQRDEDAPVHSPHARPSFARGGQGEQALGGSESADAGNAAEGQPKAVRPDRSDSPADPSDSSNGGSRQTASDSPLAVPDEASAEDPLEGGALCRVGRAWTALFPRHGLSVRLEERDGGRVGLVTRLLPGAAPSMAAWKRLQGGRTRVVAWGKAPPDVVAAFLDVLRRETQGGRGG